MKNYKIGTMLYDGELHYHVENEKGSIVIGRLTYEEANFYIDNPEVLKSTIKSYKIVGALCIIFIISFSFYYWYLND